MVELQTIYELGLSSWYYYMMRLLVVIPTNEWFSLPVRNHDKTKIRNNYTMTCYCLRKKRKKEKKT